MGPKVLIIDDEEALREALGARLLFMGFQVLEAPNGSVGLDLAKLEKPDIVLLDLMMPTITGYQVWTQFQREPELKSIPILILTAKPKSTDKFWKLSLPPEDYITKPFEMDYLVKRIREKIKAGKKD
jgi:DNA-binding response OmpR family regulator